MRNPSQGTHSFGVRALSVLAALTIAFGLVGDAVARDRPPPAPRKPRAAAVTRPAVAPYRAARFRAAARPQGPEGVHPKEPAPNRFAAAGGPHHPFASPASRQEFERHRAEHHAAIVAARSRLPVRPMPGERGFTGVPPAGETRFVSNEMVFHVPPNVPRQTVDNLAQRLGLATVDSHNVALTGGTMYRFRVADGKG